MCAPRSVVFVLFFVLVCSQDTEGQTIRGQVVDSIRGVPVGSGFVVLLNEARHEVYRTLTRRDGSFTVPVPEPGRYRLRSERIGYHASVSPPLDIQRGQTIVYLFRVGALPVMLADIGVEVEDRCHVSTVEGAATARLWEEARKALAASAWSAEQRLYYHTLVSYERELGLRRRRIYREETQTTSGYYSSPYSSLPAERLVREGYVVSRNDDTWFYAPDASVMLDDSFLSTHCFHVMLDSKDRDGQVGLAFEPVPNRDLPDVVGVLWLDQVSSELRVLEYRYEGLPRQIRDDRIGGTVEFMALPTGAWIVHRWQIRTPVLEHAEVRQVLVLRNEVRLSGFLDVGGHIAEISSLDGALLYAADVARLTGTVFDSTRGAPLDSALVRVVGTDYTAATDSDGRFELAAPLDGEYLVDFTHPRLDSVGVGPTGELVALAPASHQTIALRVPGFTSILKMLCPSDTITPEQRVLVGVVRDSASNLPVPSVQVSAQWQHLLVPGTLDGVWGSGDIQRATTTDSAGAYVLCGVPVIRPITLRADLVDSAGGLKSDSVRFWFQPDENQVRVVQKVGGRWKPYTAPDRVWKHDFSLQSIDSGLHGGTIARLRPIIVLNVVVDAQTGDPIPGSEILKSGRPLSVRADSDGLFVVSGLERGTHTFQVRAMGYRPQEFTVELNGQFEFVRIREPIRLERVAVQLRDIEVIGEGYRPGRLAGFERRRENGLGTYFTREDIEERMPLRSSDLLTGLPGGVVRCYGSECVVGTLRSGSQTSGFCTFDVYVDGIYSIRSGTGGYMDFIPPDDIAAMEVYTSIVRTPLIFSRTMPRLRSDGAGQIKVEDPRTACGVVVIWTRTR